MKLQHYLDAVKHNVVEGSAKTEADWRNVPKHCTLFSDRS